MWRVLILLNLWALYCTVSSSPPSPIDVVFSSVNLRNVLQWIPGNGTPNDTLFTVQYAIYGDSVEGSRGKRVHWRAVRHCTEIVRCWCDLSNETRDLGEGYHARVRAVSSRAYSKWASTRRRFDPKLDTIFGPPLVSVDLEDNNAIITLKGPMRYQPNNNTPVVSMATLYTHMTYNLSVHNARHGLMTHFIIVSSTYKYRLMDYDTEYCFSAKTKFLSMPVHCQPSEWHCMTTPPDPWIAQLQQVVVGIVVPCACMCMLVVVGYLLYQYLSGKGQKSPYILNPPAFHPPPLMFPHESLNIVLIKVGPPSDLECRMPHSAYAKKQQHITAPQPMYAHQRFGTPLQPEEPWENLSVDYGFVGKAPEHNIRGGAPGVYSAQAKSYLSQKSTRSETHMPKHTQTEVSELLQAHACLPVNSALVSQTQAPFLSCEQELGREEGDREFPCVFSNKSPQTSFFDSPFNIQRQNEGGLEEEIVRGGTDGTVNEGIRSERAPLLSAYASQNIINTPTSQSDQSDFLPDDYGVLSLAEATVIEEDEKVEEEDEDGTTCVEWDPNTGKLVLPEVAMEINKEGGLMQGEKRRENKTGREEEEAKGKLRLESVYVRQGSEEMAEAQREMERGEETGWEADDLFSKWNLVISMDQ
uniref:interleukin-20 receptor subunit alpha n=1 Tax=Semicossyphus pulcher TaxID=241346 RepID=UPI0037E7F72F